MNRSLLFALALGSLCSLPALAQDTPASKPADKKPADAKPEKPRASMVRVEVACTATLDDKPVKPNGMVFFFSERLYTLGGFRFDTKGAKAGHKNLDKWLGKMQRLWTKEDPEKKDPLGFTLTTTQTTKYDGSKFYGETQAHNYKGTIKAVLAGADGKEIATFEFPLSYGKLVGSGLTKREVQMRYDQRVHTAVILAVLNHPSVRAKVPANKKTKLTKWSKKEKAGLLKFLEGSTAQLRKGKMAEFVRKIKIG